MTLTPDQREQYVSLLWEIWQIAIENELTVAEDLKRCCHKLEEEKE